MNRQTELFDEPEPPCTVPCIPICCRDCPLNDCIHYLEVHKKCGLWETPCENPMRKGCYMSISARDEMLESMGYQT